jgi:hypothetical protein
MRNNPDNRGAKRPKGRLYLPIVGLRVVANGHSESWLARQRKKNHRSKVWGFLIALIIVLIACGAGIAIWLLSKNNWLKKDTHHADHTQS